MIVHHLPPIRQNWPLTARILLGLAFMALFIKLALQTGSVIPEVSKLAFGFRSIVIAYLHLVLLGFVTLFLLGYSVLTGYIRLSTTVKMGLFIFSFFVFANEFVLMIQGVAAFGYLIIPHLNEILFFISGMLFASMLLVLVMQITPRKNA